MKNKISTILFDLGGVLIELDGPPPLREEWLGLVEPISYEDKWRRWGGSVFVQSFETGKISADEFLEGIICEQGLKVDKNVFRDAFVQWPKDFLPGAKALLQELKPNYTLGFFSNTSSLHLPRLRDELSLDSFFHHVFASYEIGYFKPDINGFRHVIAQMARSADEILFVDDNMINVEGAREAGLHAEKVVGVEQTRAVLKKYGCVD